MEYYAILKKDKYDTNAYLVSFPDLPNVNTYGDTKEEALRHAAEALNGCIECDFERGYSLPKPRKINRKNAYPIPVEPHIQIAWQLRKLRNGHSQSDIAQKLGITYQAYQKLENPRKCNPTIKTLEKISRVLGWNVQISK